MPSWIICATRRCWRIGVTATITCISPAILWGQSTPPVHQADSTANQRFAEYDQSLAQAADALLVSGILSTNAVITQIGGDGIPTTSPPNHLGQQGQLRNSEGVRASAAQVNRLRPLIEPMLQLYGVPIELAAVIQVESGGYADALSPKGARGLWQLMPNTARRYQLRVDGSADDRLDINKSTRAAARYLNDLYRQFGTWTLALAAYNTGEQKVQRAIAHSGSRDFRVLSSLGLLPSETRHYVPSVMAVIQSWERPSALEEFDPAGRTTIVFAVSN